MQGTICSFCRGCVSVGRRFVNVLIPNAILTVAELRALKIIKCSFTYFYKT